MAPSGARLISVRGNAPADPARRQLVQALGAAGLLMLAPTLGAAPLALQVANVTALYPVTVARIERPVTVAEVAAMVTAVGWTRRSGPRSRPAVSRGGGADPADAGGCARIPRGFLRPGYRSADRLRQFRTGPARQPRRSAAGRSAPLESPGRRHGPAGGGSVLGGRAADGTAHNRDGVRERDGGEGGGFDLWRGHGSVVAAAGESRKGGAAAMRRTSGQKPMSIMRSASSSTRNCTRTKSVLLCRM